jgi:hypothetical protein
VDKEWRGRYLKETSLPVPHPPAKPKGGNARSSTGKAVKRGRDGGKSESSGTPRERPPRKKPADCVYEEVSESAVLARACLGRP